MPTPLIKPLGQTPLQAVEEFKSKNPEYKNAKVSYAGRLDPMAEGLLLLLIGDENKKRDEYEGLDKTYLTEIVFGITTDSFDGLGMLENTSLDTPKIQDIKNVLKSFTGKQMQSYPPYSSKAVRGKPLFWWSRKKMLSEIEIPKRNIEIFSIKILNIKKINGEILVKDILKRIEKVEGDFRQEEIVKSWGEFYKANKDRKFLKAELGVRCSSGTYIRRLASDIGHKLSSGAFCLSIKRTKIGDFSL